MKSITTYVVASILVLSLINGVDRLIWVHGGNELAGAANLTNIPVEGVDCHYSTWVEVKYIDDQLVYRCGNVPLWPLYLFPGQSGHSVALHQYWSEFTNKPRTTPGGHE